jgi:hypothetical protein
MTYEYPLSWPPGFPRTKYPAQCRFDSVGLVAVETAGQPAERGGGGSPGAGTLTHDSF